MAARRLPARLHRPHPGLRAGCVAAVLLTVVAGCAAPAAGEPRTARDRGGLSADFTRNRRALIDRLARSAGIQPPADLPAYELSASLLEKGQRTGTTRPVDPPDASGLIRRLETLPCSARDGEAEAAWLIRRAWNVEAAPVWSAGLAAVEADHLYGRSPDDLIGALAPTGLLPSLSELLEASRSILQYPTLFVPAAYRFVSWVLERHGEAGLRRAVEATWRPGGRLQELARALGTDVRQVEDDYRHALAAGATSTGGATSTAGVVAGPAGFQRGVCYAHEVNMERGYASPRSAGSLERLRRMGVNWISVTPFGYLRLDAPHISASSSFGAEAETDESLAEVISQARARGMGVLLKPHLWSSDFVGRIAMRSEADWRVFFHEYGRYLAHHAVLAGACGAAALCIGNELIEATRGRDAEWRALIRATRRLFKGPLTYGAHWQEEVERIQFWDQLDWVGVSHYAPLALEPFAPRSEWIERARREAQRLAAIARRSGKPLVLVEAGFPSHARAPLAPWEDPESGLADHHAQAAAFEAIIEAFGPQRELAGIYWWKWFTDEPPAKGDRSHRFAGKPAEDVVRRFYGGFSSGR